MYATLYVFVRGLSSDEPAPAGLNRVMVARLTDDWPSDWQLWQERYQAEHPGLRLVEIASIDVVDERAPP